MLSSSSGDVAFRADLLGLGRRVGGAAPWLHAFLQQQEQEQEHTPPGGDEDKEERDRKSIGGCNDNVGDSRGGPRDAYTEQLRQLRSRRQAYRDSARTLQRSLKSAAQAIADESQRILEDVSAAEQVGCLGALAGVVSRKEAALARTSVDYFAVLLAERNAHLESLRRELEQLEATRRHAELHGRLRLFSECAQLETVGSLQVTFLDRGGDQYQRCKKAVKDNTAPNIFDNPFFEGIKVLHVVSVKHSLLLDRIQAHSTRLGRAAKTKGLFCCLGDEEVFAFLAFGLHRRRLQQHAKSGATTRGDTPSVQPFHPPWYSKPIPASASAWDASSPRSSRRQRNAPSSADADCSNNECVAAEMAGAQKSRPFLRFSRRVSLKLLTRRQEFSHASVRTGPEQDLPFLALCRVLLHDVHAVDSATISETDIEEALQRGCDAVHSAESDEYVLLNPDYVLPEFVIHVQLEWLQPPEDLDAAPGCTPSGEALPMPPRMLPSTSRHTCPALLHARENAIEDNSDQRADKNSSRKRMTLSAEQHPESESGVGSFLSSASSASYFAPSKMSMKSALGGEVSSIADSSATRVRVANRKQRLLQDLEGAVRRAEEEARDALSAHLRDVGALIDRV